MVFKKPYAFLIKNFKIIDSPLLLWNLILRRSSINPRNAYKINTHNIINKFKLKWIFLFKNKKIIINKVLIMKITPPIVGVPSFKRCLLEIVFDILWYIWHFLKNGTTKKPNTNEDKKPNIKHKIVLVKIIFFLIKFYEF